MRLSKLVLVLALQPSEALIKKPKEDGDEAHPISNPDRDANGGGRWFFDPNKFYFRLTQAPVPAPTTAPAVVISPTDDRDGGPSGIVIVDTSSPTEAPVTSPPTVSPTLSTTNAPTVSPTFSPSDAPTTASPTESPTTSPSRSPTVSPTLSPTEAPTTPSPTGSPTKFPSDSPSASPTTSAPTLPPFDITDTTISDETLPEIFTETRKATHRYQWGSTYDGCDHDHPPVYLSCGGGGIVTGIVPFNAECEELSVDKFQCTDIVEGSAEGAYVDFNCVGITSEHITATAEVFPSEGKSCDKVYAAEVTDVTSGETTLTVGGNAAVFGVLGRECKMNNREQTIEYIYGCTKGISGQQGGTSYCATGAQCTVNQICPEDFCDVDVSCTASLEGISMSNEDDRLACSSVETNLNLMGHVFSATTIGSYHKIEWTFASGGLGCDYDIPDMTLSCANGGVIKFDDETKYPNCTVSESSISCTNPDPESTKARDTYFYEVWCYGESYEELELSVELPSLSDPSASCTMEGLAVHGVRISKGCENDLMISLPTFCDDPEQVYESSNLCWSGYYCASSMCDSGMVVLPAVSSTTSDPRLRECVRAQ